MESGQLDELSTADLLRQIADRGETGCLRIDRDGLLAFVYFRGGSVYTATAPEARARLGDRLVGAGHLTEEQLHETLRHQRSLTEPRRIGDLLIERGYVDHETVKEYVREQIADSVAATLGWTTGQWVYDAGIEVAEDVPLDMSVENLLMEGARRLSEWEVIQSRLGSLDAVVDLSPTGSQAELSLTPDEWSMLTRIDGHSTVSEIAEASGYSQFEAARIIYGLLTAGVVTRVAEEEEPWDLDAEPTPALDEFSFEDIEGVEEGVGEGFALTDEGTPVGDDLLSHDILDRMLDVPEFVAPGDEEPSRAAGSLLDDPLLDDPHTSLLDDPLPGDPPPGDPHTSLLEDDLAGLLSDAGLSDAGLSEDTAPPRGTAEPAPESREEPEPSAKPTPRVERNELLREFAALDDDLEEEQEDEGLPRIELPKAGPRVPPPDDRKAKGLFGRFRKT